jgi:hypothetical protein
VLIPGSVTVIEAAAFSGCLSLSEVDFARPSGLLAIKAGAFASCKSLRSFHIVGSVSDLADDFIAQSGVCEVTVDDRITNIFGLLILFL